MRHLKYLITIISILLLASCSTPRHRGSRGIASVFDWFKKDKIEFTKLSEEEISEFQELVERNLAWREGSILFYEKISAFEHSGKPISSDALTEMQDRFIEYRESHDKMFKIIDDMKWLTSQKYELVVKTDVPTGEDEEAWHKYSKEQVMGDHDEDDKFVQPFIINPTDEQGKLLIERFKRSFAAALVLYDNYTIAVNLYSRDSKIRRLLNFDNIKFNYFLERITKNYVGVGNRFRVARSVEVIKSLERVQNKSAMSQNESYFDDVINSSQFFYLFQKEGPSSGKIGKLKFYRQSISDHFNRVSRATTYGLSKFFGNGMGIFASRKGKMLSLSKESLHDIERRLKPLDILLEKTPFRLTDKFIPGHYGHVAIWVGTERELKGLGLWEHDLIKPYQEQIRQGHKIIEALRPGVQINTLHHFMNIDDFAVLRLKEELSKEQKADYMLNAFRQIGKTYDFNFDVETDKRIVCSELAYVVYDDMEWPTEKAVGRITISPDNVAIKALDDGPFEVAMIFYDGKEIMSNLQKNFDHLLKLEYDQVTY